MTQPASTGARRRRWRRALRARRRWIAAVLVAGATAFALESLAPPQPPTAQVVVASADLAPGHVLRAEDLKVADWPAEVAPLGALDAVTTAVGRELSGPVGRGEPLTGLRFIGPSLLGSLADAGRVAVPVRLADADVARLVHPGDRVDVVAATSGSADPISGSAAPASARVVAAAATVITVPETGGGRTFTAGTTTSAGSLIVVAVTRSEALELAGAAVLGPVSLVLVG